MFSFGSKLLKPEAQIENAIVLILILLCGPFFNVRNIVLI